MRQLAEKLVAILVAGGVGAALAVVALPVSGQAPASSVPRLADGKPDLNGIWQAHERSQLRHPDARGAAGDGAARRALRAGSRRAGPRAGRGRRGAARRRRRRGRRAPVSAGGADARSRENQENWLTRDPEIKCYLPGVPRATYMPYPFQILQSTSSCLHRLRVRGRRARHLPEGSGPGAGRLLDGTVGWPLGRRHAGRRRHRLQRPDVVRPRPATSTATPCTWSSATRARAPT